MLELTPALVASSRWFHATWYRQKRSIGVAIVGRRDGSGTWTVRRPPRDYLSHGGPVAGKERVLGESAPPEPVSQ